MYWQQQDPKWVASSWGMPFYFLHLLGNRVWDTLGHSGCLGLSLKMFWGLVFSRKVQFFRIFELLALRLLQQIFPGPSSEVLHTELRKILHLHHQKCYTLNLEKFYTSILRSVTKDLENFLNLWILYPTDPMLVTCLADKTNHPVRRAESQ